MRLLSDRDPLGQVGFFATFPTSDNCRQLCMQVLFTRKTGSLCCRRPEQCVPSLVFHENEMKATILPGAPAHWLPCCELVILHPPVQLVQSRGFPRWLVLPHKLQRTDCRVPSHRRALWLQLWLQRHREACSTALHQSSRPLPQEPDPRAHGALMPGFSAWCASSHF